MKSRREFLKLSGIAGVGLIACGDDDGGVDGAPPDAAGQDGGPLADGMSRDGMDPDAVGGSDAAEMDGGVPQGDGPTPLLGGFRVDPMFPDRLYFDSSEEMAAATTFAGLTVSYKEVTSVHIRAGSRTGHYWGVSPAFTFWDNNTIKYDGGDDLRGTGGHSVHPFTLQYVANAIPEPAAGTGVFFVDVATGDDSNGGRSEGDAFRTIQYGVSQAGAGDTVWVKAGEYGRERNINTSVAGAPESPIRVIGYKATPGDITDLYYRYGDGDLDASEMPTLTGEEEGDYAFRLRDDTGNYVMIKNFQVRGYLRGVHAPNRVGVVVENCLFMENSLRNDSGRAIDLTRSERVEGGTKWANGYSKILGCLSIDASNTAFGVWSSGNLIDGCSSYSTQTSGGSGPSQDYYFDISGSHNIVRGCHAERASEDVSHAGHGYNLKAHPYDFDEGETRVEVSHNLVERCFCRGVKENYMVRNLRADHNVFKDCVGRGFTGAKDEDSFGIVIRGGASFNVFERMRIHTCDVAIEFDTNQENRTQDWVHAEYAAEGNRIRNCTFNDVFYMFRFNHRHEDNDDMPVVWTIRDNHVQNCTFNNIFRVARTFKPSANYAFSGNSFVNCVFEETGVNAMNDSSNPWSYEEVRPFEYDTCAFFGGQGFLSWATNSMEVSADLDAELRPRAAALRGGLPLEGVEYDAGSPPRERHLESPTIGAFELEAPAEE